MIKKSPLDAPEDQQTTPIFVNRVLLEHSNGHSGQGTTLLSHYSSRADASLYDLQSPKHSLYGPLQKKSAKL